MRQAAELLLRFALSTVALDDDPCPVGGSLMWRVLDSETKVREPIGLDVTVTGRIRLREPKFRSAQVRAQRHPGRRQHRGYGCHNECPVRHARSYDRLLHAPSRS